MQTNLLSKEVLIVIPVYKEQLSKSEELSLGQVRRVLKNYQICFVSPERMRHFFSKKNLKAEYFSDDYFKSMYSYSKLLLNSAFYQRFEEYKYILIYQLDAFVFYDKLDYFCSLNYDYIGAPMLMPWLYEILPTSQNVVGNGGFSLRKVSSCIQVTKNKEKIYDISGKKDLFENLEDLFFGFCGAEQAINFSVPSAKIANTFSMQDNVFHCYQHLSEKNLPFGCHAWSKNYYFYFWKSYIGKYADSLEDMTREIYANGIKDYKTVIFDRFKRYLISRIFRHSNNYEMLDIMKKYIPINEKYILWGNGRIGERAYSLLKFFNIGIVCIFDKDVKNDKMKNNVLVKSLDIKWATSNGYKILITTRKYLNEISNSLIEFGLEKDKDFFNYYNSEDKFLREYYGNIWFNMKNNRRLE